jgi:hypothetical protein
MKAAKNYCAISRAPDSVRGYRKIMIPTLNTARLTLHPLQPTDAPILHHIY